MMPGDPEKASEEIAKIEGVYKYQFKNGDITGHAYQSEDILEIVRVAKDVIYFKEKLQCFNGCSCEVYGLAKYKKPGLFLFSDNGNNYNKKECLLKIIPSNNGIKLDSNEHCQQYCGIRGILDNDNFTYVKRRTIRYMKLLKNSQEYKSSVSNFRKI